VGLPAKTSPLLPYTAAAAMLVAAISLREAIPTPRVSPEEIERYLQRELEARVGAVLEWEHARRSRVEAIADTPELQREVAVESSRSLDRVLADLCVGLVGCALSRPDGTPWVSSGGARPPTELVRQAARGRTVQSRLVSPEAVGRSGRSGDAHYAMYFATPVVEGGVVRAVLAGRVHPDEELGPILGRHPPGRTGETYAVDPEGNLVTRTRFEPLRQGPMRVPRVIAEPKKWLHFAEAARPLRSGADVSGYRDYRGVRVVGAWRWIDELGAAVVTEMDASEAYSMTALR
jgi:hypothetical protein